MRLQLRLACALGAVPVLAQHPIVGIEVTGNERLQPAAIIAAAGLAQGQAVTRKDLDAATQKLFDTGLFLAANYRYDPKPSGAGTGWEITLEVSEETATMPIVFDIPGLDEERMWHDLIAADPLIEKRMPDNDRATEYYKRAMERVLQKLNRPEPLAVKTELESGAMLAVFRPANLPKIASIEFQGNASIPSSRLQGAIVKLAVGEPYSERDLRRVVEMNLRPIYEETGRLTVSFPHLKAASASDAATITVEVNEGPVWRLGKVQLTGPGLPASEMLAAAKFAEGQPANWKQFMTSIREMQQVLLREGYLSTASKPVRSFHEADQVVDVTVEVAKGQQFMFGELHVNGLEPGLQKMAMSLWKLPAGAPMNEPYIEEYLRDVFHNLHGAAKAVKRDMATRPGTNITDVNLTFR